MTDLQCFWRAVQGLAAPYLPKSKRNRTEVQKLLATAALLRLAVGNELKVMVLGESRLNSFQSSRNFAEEIMYQLAFSRRRDALWSARPLTCPSLVFAPEMVQYQRHPKLRAVGALRSPPAKQLVWQQAALRPCKPEWWRNQMGGQAGNSAGF